jgi:hypothetical protein
MNIEDAFKTDICFQKFVLHRYLFDVFPHNVFCALITEVLFAVIS